MSLGEIRVRVTFNPSGNTDVDEIKRRTAELIDFVYALNRNDESERLRLINLAMTAYEQAAMWAVKAATYE